MSGLDQPIVIANSCYHVGHERSWRAAEEQGYVKEEGLGPYVYERGGLIPGEWEFYGLGRQMWERGVDVATAVDVRAAVVQRARGEDLYIVGGWRTQLASKLIGAKGLTRPEDLKGARSVVREKWGLNHIGIIYALQTFGVAQDDIEWVENSLSGYGNDPNLADMLRTGEVTVLPASGREASQLLSEGYPLVLDLEAYYKSLGPWPPGKVIVATKQTVEQRGEDLRAILRASLRGFWFVQNPHNHSAMFDLETRLRDATFNEDERRLRMLKAETPEPRREDSMSMGSMVMDGLVPRPALAGVIKGLVQAGQVPPETSVDDVLRDEASIDAYNNLVSRGLIDLQVIERWQRSLS